MAKKTDNKKKRQPTTKGRRADLTNKLILPDGLIEDKSLSDNQLIILHKLYYLSRLQNNHGKGYNCYASHGVLMDMSSSLNNFNDELLIDNRGKIAYAVDRLASKGLIEIVKSGSRQEGATEYRLKFLPDEEDGRNDGTDSEKAGFNYGFNYPNALNANGLRKVKNDVGINPDEGMVKSAEKASKNDSPDGVGFNYGFNYLNALKASILKSTENAPSEPFETNPVKSPDLTQNTEYINTNPLLRKGSKTHTYSERINCVTSEDVAREETSRGIEDAVISEHALELSQEFFVSGGKTIPSPQTPNPKKPTTMETSANQNIIGQNATDVHNAPQPMEVNPQSVHSATPEPQGAQPSSPQGAPAPQGDDIATRFMAEAVRKRNDARLKTNVNNPNRPSDAELRAVQKRISEEERINRAQFDAMKKTGVIDSVTGFQYWTDAQGNWLLQSRDAIRQRVMDWWFIGWQVCKGLSIYSPEFAYLAAVFDLLESVADTDKRIHWLDVMYRFRQCRCDSKGALASLYSHTSLFAKAYGVAADKDYETVSKRIEQEGEGLYSPVQPVVQTSVLDQKPEALSAAAEEPERRRAGIYVDARTGIEFQIGGDGRFTDIARRSIGHILSDLRRDIDKSSGYKEVSRWSDEVFKLMANERGTAARRDTYDHIAEMYEAYGYEEDRHLRRVFETVELFTEASGIEELGLEYTFKSESA